MIPNQFGPPDQMVPRIFCLSRGKSCGDTEIIGPNWSGSSCPGGPHFWGPFVQGDQIFGTICPGGQKLIVQGDQFFSDHLSMGTESGGPEVWGSIGFGTK